MSSNASAPRIDIELAPQQAVLVFVLGVHAVALAALLSAIALPAWALAVVAGAIVASCAGCLAVHWRLATPRCVRRLTWLGDGRWRLVDARGEHAGCLVDYFTGRRLLILKFKGHPAVLLWSQAADDAARRLRVRLRHGPPVLRGGSLAIRRHAATR
jgi:hypothetical protein